MERLEKHKRLIGNPLLAETKVIISDKSNALEYLAFSGLYSNVIEFRQVNRNVLYPYAKQHDTKLSLDEMLRRLLFL